MTTPKTMREAEAYAAQHGILLSDRERDHIAQAQASELARLESITPVLPPDMAARWNTFYPRLLKSIISIGETVLTFAQTIIVSLGVPVVLVLLLIVEHQRVVHGIQLFETDHGLASFAAMALVLLNLVLEFQIHHIEHKAGYIQEPDKRWSLWIWLQSAAYTVGLGDGWKEQYLSPAQRYKGLLRLVTFSILALALVGSMRSVIESQPGAWYEAIGAIVSESSLLLLMTWIGGLLFAAAAVLAAQGLSRYVAIRCVEIISAMNADQSQDAMPHADEIDYAGAMALVSIVNAKLEQKAAKEAAKKPAVKPVEAVIIEQPRPFGSTHHTQDARESTVIHPLETVSVSVVSANGNGHHA